MRRRVWFFVIRLDGLLSFQVGLPSNIREEFHDTKQPRNIHDWELYEGMKELPPSRPSSEVTPIAYLIAKNRGGLHTSEHGRGRKRGGPAGFWKPSAAAALQTARSLSTPRTCSDPCSGLKTQIVYFRVCGIDLRFLSRGWRLKEWYQTRDPDMGALSADVGLTRSFVCLKIVASGMTSHRLTIA